MTCIRLVYVNTRFWLAPVFVLSYMHICLMQTCRSKCDLICRTSLWCVLMFSVSHDYVRYRKLWRHSISTHSGGLCRALITVLPQSQSSLTIPIIKIINDAPNDIVDNGNEVASQRQSIEVISCSRPWRVRCELSTYLTNFKTHRGKHRISLPWWN